ncbi:MFS transporter [Streptomyces sp. NPDC005438]|uniref:MFS transporter n=1 Tax=Streptomyces sp. NPDC005438 TaxID=3156880 RepID=UPI0033A0F0EA
MAVAQTTLIRDGRVLLRFADFRRLLAVRLLSQLADGVYQMALAAYVVFSPERAASPAAIASAMAVLLLPYSLLGPFAGVLLDRWRRRQVLLHGNLLRAVLALGTTSLVLAPSPDWLFYLSALSVTAVNRFVLAGLSASLPRVVDADRLVLANSLSPTAGTVAAAAGGGLGFLVRLLAPQGSTGEAAVVLLGAVVYLLAALATLNMTPELLGPDPGQVQPRLGAAVASTARGLVAGLRHLHARPMAAASLAAMTLMRFCFGALTVTLLMLCRYSWGDGEGDSGLELLGLAVALSGVGFFLAALITPVTARRWGPLGWLTRCALGGAVLAPALGSTFQTVPWLVAALALGVVTQGAKIATDTVVQSSVDDAFRGRVFSLYDMLFNVAFVASAALSALIIPPDGRSLTLVITVGLLYLSTAVAISRFRRQ